MGSEVTIRFPLLADLSVSDRRWLLWDLLKMFDPGLEGDPAEYEAYQKACEVVLERAGKVD